MVGKYERGNAIPSIEVAKRIADATVPVHKNPDLPKGLLRKIIREDLELELDTFIELWNKH